MLNKINYCLFSIFLFAVLSKSAQAQILLWDSVTDSEGAEHEGVRLLSEDQDGNVFIVGNYTGDFSWAGQSFEHSGNVNPGGSDAFLTKLSPSGTPLWSTSLGDPSTQVSSIQGLVNDLEGNVYLCGILQPTVPGLMISFAGFELTVNPPNLMYICKIDADGNGVWINEYAAGPGPTGFLLTVRPTLGIDSNDNLILGGSFTGTLDFDGTILSVAGNQFEHFTSKFDSDGNALWAKSFGSANTEQNLTSNVASDDGILLGGAWSGDSLFLGDLFVVNDDPVSGGNFDRWIGKLNSDGEAISLSREAVGGDFEFNVIPSAIAPGPNGGAMVLSAVNQPINIGGEEITENGMLITNYNVEGALGSVEFIADLTPSRTIIPDGNGNYFYGGTFTTQEITIASDVFTNVGGETGTSDALLIQCNENGEANYALQIGDAESESISRLRMMSTGQLSVAGTYNSSSLTLSDEILENTGFLTNDFFLGTLDFTSGIGGVAEIQNLKIFPNPSSSIVNIDLQELSNGKTSLRIFNTTGQTVYAANVSGQTYYQIDVESFDNGLYLVELINNEQRYAGKILIE